MELGVQGSFLLERPKEVVTVPQQEAAIPQKNPFESNHTLRLIFRFAIPCVVSFLVSAIYNIVDQIFIGQVVGYLGNAATNVMFPIVTLSVAASVLVGDGTAANMNLKMGAGQKDLVSKIFANGLTLILIIAGAYTVLCAVCMTNLLIGFGATEAILPYAVDYTEIIILGLPFNMMSIMLNSSIRADGNPRYAMIAMLTGAVLNIALDAWFMFGFGLGVRGAALATIVGQIITWLMCIRYLPRYRNFKFDRKDMALHGRYFGRSLALGMSSFITQIAIAFVQIVMNNVIVLYGASSAYGTDIPLSAIGIVMKVNMILISSILGFAVGSQPIWGYNYGAGRFRQVIRIYVYTVLIASGIAVAGWILFQTSPDTVINWFGQEDALYNEFAERCFRTFLFAVFCAGFQITSSIFFQAIGKPVRSIVLSLSRQTLFLIPLLIILPTYVGLDGILYAGPIADLAAAALAAFLIAFEMVHLTKLARGSGGSAGTGLQPDMSAG